MAHHSDIDPAPRVRDVLRHRIAEGTSLATAMLLFTVAVMSFLEGLSAVVHDDRYRAGLQYTYRFDTVSWGWIHIVLGLVLALCSAGLLTGTLWGRYAAICLAALSIVTNFLALPHCPSWSIPVIAMDVVVIWAIASWRPAPLHA